MSITSYRELIVWQKGIELATDIFKTTRGLPPRDQWALGVQIQKAAVSIPANVAEGWARGTGRAYPFFLRVAIGSEAELQTELEIAIRAGIINGTAGPPLIARTAEVGKMLNGLLRSVSDRGNPGHRGPLGP
jgi:four helix bundle protein